MLSATLAEASNVNDAVQRDLPNAPAGPRFTACGSGGDPHGLMLACPPHRAGRHSAGMCGASGIVLLLVATRLKFELMGKNRENGESQRRLPKSPIPMSPAPKSGREGQAVDRQETVLAGAVF